MNLRKLTPLTVLAVLALVPAAHARQPGAPVPRAFIGMNADGPLLRPPVDLDSEISTMVAAGVRSIRTAFYWSDAQPYASFAEVPPADRSRFEDVGGVPTDFSTFDRIVGAAAAHRATVLPTVLASPSWAARHPGVSASPPASTGQYARFLAALVGRYGPTGRFWSARPALPRVPIRDWQIWNEPNAKTYWSDQPFMKDYVALLQASRAAIEPLDRRARIVLAGFAGRSWTALARLYAAGARRDFDVAAVHPFSLQVANVMRILREDRVVMSRYHDAGKPMFATEASWPSAKGKTSVKYGFEVSDTGEAVKVRRALTALAAARSALRLERVYWYTWISADSSPVLPFDYAGLRTLDKSGRVVPKPAYAAFKRTALALERR